MRPNGTTRLALVRVAAAGAGTRRSNDGAGAYTATDAHASPPVLSAAAFRIPTLVVGGERDRLVWRASTARTALYHGGEPRTAYGMGHFLHLDVGAAELAGDILAWLDGQGV